MAQRLLVLFSAMALVLAACGGTNADDQPIDNGGDVPTAGAPDVGNGEKVFSNACVACHGNSGVGIDGLGKPLPDSTFVAGLDDAGLAAFIKTGRDRDDPDNTTGVEMPASGGQDLSEQEIVDVVAYIRTLS